MRRILWNYVTKSMVIEMVKVFLLALKLIFVQHSTWKSSGNALPFPVHLQLRQDPGERKETGDGIRAIRSVVLPPGFVVCTGEAFKWFMIIWYHIISYMNVFNSVRIRTVGKNWGKIIHARDCFLTCWYCIIQKDEFIWFQGFPQNLNTLIFSWNWHLTKSCVLQKSFWDWWITASMQEILLLQTGSPISSGFYSPLEKVNWKRSTKVGDQGRMAKFILILGAEVVAATAFAIFSCLLSEQ